MAPVSMTLSDLQPTFQGHDNIRRKITPLLSKAIVQGHGIIQRQITRKWYKIEL